jgi:hypothetical protein
MPHKHPDAERIGGPGAAHENRKHPEKSRKRRERPEDGKSGVRSKVSGGGGERDSHHTRDRSSRAAIKKGLRDSPAY